MTRYKLPYLNVGKEKRSTNNMWTTHRRTMVDPQRDPHQVLPCCCRSPELPLLEDQQVDVLGFVGLQCLNVECIYEETNFVLIFFLI